MRESGEAAAGLISPYRISTSFLYPPFRFCPSPLGLRPIGGGWLHFSYTSESYTWDRDDVVAAADEGLVGGSAMALTVAHLEEDVDTRLAAGSAAEAGEM